jgi:hypothetical protein
MVLIARVIGRIKHRSPAGVASELFQRKGRTTVPLGITRIQIRVRIIEVFRVKHQLMEEAQCGHETAALEYFVIGNIHDVDEIRIRSLKQWDVSRWYSGPA